MYYSEEEITNLLAKINIKDIIEKYIKLEKIGNKWFGICPFHKESSPSFIVDEKKQMYYCFGCGKTGNVIHFIMDYNKISFEEAINKLGLIKKQEIYENSKLIEINKTAENLYKENLKQSKEALQYAEERGLTKEIIEKFGIGYKGMNFGADAIVSFAS